MNPLPQQNLISDLGLDALPQKTQEEIMLKLGTVIYQGILIRAMEILTDAQKDALDAKLEAEGDEALFPFLQQNIPDFNAIIEAEVAKVKKDSADFLAALRKSS